LELFREAHFDCYWDNLYVGYYSLTSRPTLYVEGEEILLERMGRITSLVSRGSSLALRGIITNSRACFSWWLSFSLAGNYCWALFLLVDAIIIIGNYCWVHSLTIESFIEFMGMDLYYFVRYTHYWVHLYSLYKLVISIIFMLQVQI